MRESCGPGAGGCRLTGKVYSPPLLNLKRNRLAPGERGCTFYIVSVPSCAFRGVVCLEGRRGRGGDSDLQYWMHIKVAPDGFVVDGGDCLTCSLVLLGLYCWFSMCTPLGCP